MPRLFSSVAATLIIPFLTSSAAELFDVAVVGAGISGLAAANSLVEAGKSVVLLEARCRVGGRVENVYLDNGGFTEVGGTFVGPTQDKVLEYITQLGLETFKTYNTGNATASLGGQLIPLPSLDDFTALGPEVLEQVGSLLVQLDTWAASIDVKDPWSHENATQWDTRTFGDLVNGTVSSSEGQAVVRISTEAVWSASPEQLSLLEVLTHIAGAGNETNVGNLLRLLATERGAQESRIVGGSALVPDRLAEKVGWQRIIFNNPVTSILQQHNGHYKIVGERKTVRARKVIVAMSPPLAGHIKFDPPLPHDRVQLSRRMFHGSIGKANAIYKRPFWRENGLSGQTISDRDTVSTTFDDSDTNATYGAILGFIQGQTMRALDHASENEIIAKVWKEYVSFFGPDAANVKQWVVKRWDTDRYSQGGPFAMAGPGVLSKYGHALTQSFNGIHWAGTEASDYWPGFMDGAIRSGERAAKEVLGS